MNIVLIGAPGSGKGTQAKKLVSKKKLKHLSTGDLFRQNLQEGTPLGQKAKSYIEQGLLVPDAVTNDMVKLFLQSVSESQGIIFDGFPRNLSQAKAFEQILSEANRQLDKLIYFKIEDKQVVERLIGRRLASKSGRVYHMKNYPPKRAGVCDESGEPLVTRSDDKEELIRFRLKLFYENTKPLLEYYEQKGCLESLSAEHSPEEIFGQILQIIRKMKKIDGS